MLFTVKGYKCFRNEVQIDINEVNLLWGPMGAGKSAILESLTIFIDILRGNFELEPEEYTVSKSSLDHLKGIKIDDLVNLSEKEMIIGLEDMNYSLTITFNKESKMCHVTLKNREKEIASIRELDVIRVSRVIGEVKNRISAGRSDEKISREEEDFVKKVLVTSEREPNLKEYLNRLLDGSLIYISHHRPSPHEVKFSEDMLTGLLNWSSTGENILGFIFDLIVHRIKKEKGITDFEQSLKDLGVIEKEPSIEFDTRKPLEDSTARIDGKSLKVLSCGERNAILLLLGSFVLPSKGFLLIEEPEIGLHIRNFDKLFTILLDRLSQKKAKLLLSTHSPILLHTLRSQIIKGKITRDKVNLYYMTREGEKIELLKLELDEKGRPILTPDVRDVLRSEIDINVLKRSL